MNGANMIGGAVIGNPGPSWHVKGTGDFNNDGRADILLQNDSGEAVDLGDERHQCDRRRQPRQSGAGLAHHGDRRL
jgi:hypothetical protein